MTTALESIGQWLQIISEWPASFHMFALMVFLSFWGVYVFVGVSYLMRGLYEGDSSQSLELAIEAVFWPLFGLYRVWKYKTWRHRPHFLQKED